MKKPVVLRDLLSQEAVISCFEASSKQELIKALAEKAAVLSGSEPTSVFDVLWEREKLGTTGVGDGIAIPHGRIPGVTQVTAFFARLAAPVDYESVDGRPVDLVFALLAPSDAGADHLHALAAASRLLRNAAFCENLRQAKTDKELFTILTTTTLPAEAA